MTVSPLPFLSLTTPVLLLLLLTFSTEPLLMSVTTVLVLEVVEDVEILTALVVTADSEVPSIDDKDCC